MGNEDSNLLHTEITPNYVYLCDSQTFLYSALWCIQRRRRTNDSDRGAVIASGSVQFRATTNHVSIKVHIQEY